MKRIGVPLVSSSRTRTERTAFVRLILALACFAVLAGGAYLRNGRTAEASTPTQSANVSQDGIWRAVQDRSADNGYTQGAHLGIRVELNRDALVALLRRAPLDFSNAAKSAPIVMPLPMPDGSFARFRVVESPIMEPELAAKFPDIKTYSGQGIDDPTATTRFDWTPAGLHAVVLSLQGIISISPSSNNDQTAYVTYNEKDQPRTSGDFRCQVDESKEKLLGQVPEMSPNFVIGATLRTYRLAMGVTAEWTQAYGGGTVAGGLAAVTTAVNNINALLEKEVAIRLILVANENLLIFTNTATDGYTHCADPNFCDVSTILDVENQTKLDSVIGSANYDIGHVMDGEVIANGYSAFGAAFFGVCVNGVKGKAGGVYRSSPPDSPQCLRTLAHEMGHQFFARHSYNGTTSGCTQRDSLSAYEPGSGSTIMSYTGNCAADNLPATSLYHTATLEQIIAYSTTGTGNTCAQQISTGNRPPDLAPGGAFTIPKGTPFTLTAFASDVDGDMLTYSWEEFDNASATAPPNTDADGQQRPIFRVFDPVISPSRTFPQLSDILSNTSTFGEALPAITRAMTFKVTVRDNRAGGGGVVNGATTVSVTGGAGPFAVTAPNTSVTWTGASSQAVTWSVNSTNVAPVNCANVKINLSTDGGSTFPLILAASTPNDGTENITVPNGLSTSQARVKVEAVGNIFFDISNANFTVTPSGTCPAIASLSQSIGSVGTSVVITGANFTGVTAVKFFNNVTAAFTINSGTQITTTVPSGAASGPITISKTGCSDLQSSVFTVSSSAPSDLIADNNPFSFGCLAAGSPGNTPHYVNRLTPSSYPATLTSVSIYFPNCSLTVGTAITILVGNNPDGDSNINNTLLQTTPATVQALNAFNTYLVPNVTITSGDFVVGFRITTASGVFPAPYDGAVPHLQRSYISFDGTNFDLLDNIFPGIPGNFGIRARVYSGAANCPTVTNISPSAGPAGTTVTITGMNLAGVTKAQFATNITVSFNIISDTQITTTVPNGAVTGSITVTKTGCSDVQTGTFTINPTAVGLIDFTATTYDDGVLIQWQTGFEVDNLGFNIYREEGGKRTLITPQLVAGSALKANSTSGAGASYAWWDKTETRNAAYVLEDIDLKGFSTWHTPTYLRQVGSPPPNRSQPALLSKLGSSQAQLDKTFPVEETASSSPVSVDQTRVQASLASQLAVKIVIKRQGWYRVTQPELVAAGFNTKVDPRSLQLFVDGRELPIIVQGEQDRSLDPTDEIEFYGIGLESPFTDSRVYWLTAGNQPGLRIRQLTSAGAPSASSSFTHTVQRRDCTIYFSALRNGETENFFGAVIANNPVDQSITISRISASASHSAVLEVALQGVTLSQHRVNVELNGAQLGAFDFDGQSRGVRKFDVPQSLLTEGQNNVRLTPLGGSGDITLVDIIRVSYQHSFTADNDSLRFTAPGYQLVTIDGFTSNSVRAIDVTDPEAPREIIGAIEKKNGVYSITIAPPAADERSVLVFTADQRPASLSLNAPSNLRAGGGDFVIITRRGFATSLGPLASLHQGQGLSVAVVDLEDIYDEFSFGEETPYAVRDFLAYGNSHWKKKPRFVLFAGDASFDPKNYLGFRDADLVPTKLIDTDFLETSSDDWFSDFNNDGIADIATGRLPARNSEDMSTMVSKIIRLEHSSPVNEVLLVSDANDGFDFEQASAQLKSLIPPILKITQLNRGGLDAEAARRLLFAALYRKQSVINYVGHGSANQWRASLLTNADALALANDHPPLFVMMTCLNGYFHDAAADSLGESLIKAERGGAAAVWASSGMTLPTDQAFLNQELYRWLFSADQAPTIGEAVMRAKTSSSSSDVRRTWILLGDPAMKVRR